MTGGRQPDRWFVCAKPNPGTNVRLFCFPYAGGSASIFWKWSARLPSAVESWTVEFPGHGTRFSEAPFTRLRPLTLALVQALHPYLDKPFAFFGHSMGALVSFELARELQTRHGLSPIHLFVAGHRAPHVPDPDPPIYALPEPEFLEKVRVLNGTPQGLLEHTEFVQVLVPILRADFELCETYVYSTGPRLKCPISAFGGLEDPKVRREDLEAWREQTSAPFTLRMLPGDHFFLNTAQLSLLKVLSRDLLDLPNSVI